MVAEFRTEQAARSEAVRERTIVCPDPVAFSRDWLGIDPWPRQAELLRAVAENSRTAVRSGHKVSKSCSFAILALWWWATKPLGRVILTAPTARQVEEVLWREIVLRYQRAKRPLGGRLYVKPDGGLRSQDGREVFGFATDDPDRFSGISGPNVLYLVDEASGVGERIFEAIEGNRAGGAKLALAGNPTNTSGTFYEVFRHATPGWKRLHISSIEAAEYQEKVRVIEGLATREWVEEKRTEWEGTPLWDVRVLGEFPQQSEYAVIPLGLLEAAKERWLDAMKALTELQGDARYKAETEHGPLELGVDVARYGDDETVIAPRRGKFVYRQIGMRSMDGPAVAGKVLEVIRGMVLRDRHGRPMERPTVKFDVIGYGASAFDHANTFFLDEMDPVAMNVATRATDPTCNILRDQLWWSGRDFLKAGGTVPDDGKLEQELLAPVYSIPKGKIIVESKDETKKKLKPPRSPDHADSYLMAVFRAEVFHCETSHTDVMDL